MIDTDKMRQLMQKLKDQGDISVNEADQIRSFMKDVYNFAFELEQERHAPNAETMTSWDAQRLLHEQFPVAALQDWYKAVARQIEKGQSGNFIFSIPIDREMLFFNKSALPALEALEKYGKPEDRIMAIWANEKAFSLFPKCLANLFRWDEYEQMYALQSERAGLLRYPHVENGKVYTLWQFLHEVSLSPLLTLPGDFAFLTSSSLFANASTIPFALEYLKRKTCYMTIAEVNASDEDRTTVFVDKKHLSMARIALSVPFEDIVKNALAQKIVDKDLVKELLNSDKETEWFLDIKLINAGIRYIEEAVKVKMEWEAKRKEVEESNEWLEEVR